MQVFEGQDFRQGYTDRDSGAIFEGFEFRRCYFESYSLSLTNDPALRSTVRKVGLIDCQQRGCAVYAAIMEDIVVCGLNTSGQLLQTFGAVFNRVELRGKLDRLMISNDVLPSILLAKADRQNQIDLFRAANAEYYRDVEWALDISQGEFKEFCLRGVPTHLIRRDPTTQVVVTRAKALEGNWKRISFRENLWPTSLHYFLERGEPSIVLVAPKRHRKFRSYLDDLELLRDVGVAEPN
jgi:hypothetical protein